MKAMQYTFMVAIVHILYGILVSVSGGYSLEKRMNATENARKAMNIFLETAKMERE